MPTLAPEVRSDLTAAAKAANRFWEANRRALNHTQPAVANLLDAVQLDVEWVYARDGSLTCMESGRWWAGCSVPLLAGRMLLRTLSDEPLGSCQLLPAHAGLVRASREQMGSCPLLFVAQPDVRIARMILSTYDFSDQIDRHRFWIVSGDSWLTQLGQIFSDFPGVATPLRFIRTRLTPDEATAPMISEIQNVFSRVLADRAEAMNQMRLRTNIKTDANRLLFVGGTEFRLWDFGSRVLEKQLAGKENLRIDRFDLDDALCGSPLALLAAVAGCGAVISSDVCRADCNQLLSTDIPWVTWMTQPGAPPFDTAGPRDALILADEKWLPIARVAGWPADRIRVCGWPGNAVGLANSPAQLGMICDTRKVQVPASIADFSSHRLLWELIEEELAANPLVVEDVDAYLSNRAGQLNIATDVLDGPKFVEDLILPAYQQGLAKLLISAGIPVRIWGKGWDELPEFTAQFAGTISNPREFESAVASCRGLIYYQPRRWAHAMEMTGKPVVYRDGADRAALLRDARRVLSGERKAVPKPADDQLGRLILDLIRRPG